MRANTKRVLKPTGHRQASTRAGRIFGVMVEADHRPLSQKTRSARTHRAMAA